MKICFIQKHSEADFYVSCKIKTDSIHHSHRREDVVNKGKSSVDELPLLIVEGVAIINVEFTNCSSLPNEKVKALKIYN